MNNVVILAFAFATTGLTALCAAALILDLIDRIWARHGSESSHES